MGIAIILSLFEWLLGEPLVWYFSINLKESEIFTRFQRIDFRNPDLRWPTVHSSLWTQNTNIWPSLFVSKWIVNSNSLEGNNGKSVEISYFWSIVENYSLFKITFQFFFRNFALRIRNLDEQWNKGQILTLFLVHPVSHFRFKFNFLLNWEGFCIMEMETIVNF